MTQYNGEEKRKMSYNYPIEEKLVKMETKLDAVPTQIREGILLHEEKTALILQSLTKNQDILMKKTLLGNGDDALVVTIKNHSESISTINSNLEANKSEHVALLDGLSRLTKRMEPVAAHHEKKEKIMIKVWAGFILALMGGGGSIAYLIYIIQETLKKVGG